MTAAGQGVAWSPPTASMDCHERLPEHVAHGTQCHVADNMQRKLELKLPEIIASRWNMSGDRNAP